MHPALQRARREGTPLIDGEWVTFVWHGEQAPRLIADFSEWEANPLELEQAAADVWLLRANFPRDAYIEYAFLEAESDERPADRFNPRRVSNGLGKVNHYFYMPDGKPTPLRRPQPGLQQGHLSRHWLETGWLGSKPRRVDLYQPPVDEPCPLVVVYDGRDYLERAKLATLVDNLITQGRIRPLALALLENGGRMRQLEYGCSDVTLGWLLQTVLPFAYQHLNLIDLDEQPGAFGVLGASMGGLMALYSGLRLPQVFGQVLSQSGAFAIPEAQFLVFEMVKHLPKAPLRLWLDCGMFEFLLDSNRQMSALLENQGYASVYREYPAGHNYTAWRDDVWRGLEWLFPPE